MSERLDIPKHLIEHAVLGVKAGGGGSSSGIIGPATSIDSDIVVFNGTTGKVIKDSGVTINSLKSDNRLISTGLISGGKLSIISNTQFQITAGTGVIVGNYADTTSPTITPVAWNMQTLTDTLIASTTTTYVYIDNTGTVNLFPNKLTDDQRRDYIEIGWLDHPGQTQIQFAKTEPINFANNVQSQLSDFLINFGSFNIIGNVYSGIVNLTIQRSAGSVFEVGSSYDTDVKDPHVFTTNYEAPVNILYYYRNGKGGWINNLPSVINVDPNNYDGNSSTGLVKVPTGAWTIQLLSYYAMEDANDIQYGQAYYSSLADAKAHLRDDITINSFNLADVVRGWLIVQQGCTNLLNTSTALFITTGKLTLSDISIGGIGGSGGETNTASNQGLTGIGPFIQKLGVDLQFKNIEAGTSNITITDDPSNKAIKISMSSTAIVGTYATKTSNYTILPVDSNSTIYGNTLLSSLIFTMPDCVYNPIFVVTIKNIVGNNLLTLNTIKNQNFEGNPTTTSIILYNNETVTIKSDGTTWRIF